MFAAIRLLLVWVPLGSLAGIIGIPWSMLVGNVRWMYGAAMWVIRAGLRFGGIRVKVTGLEHIPAGRQCIFMCNHVSNLDPPVIMPIIPGYISVLLKKELMAIPILGRALRMGRFIPVERGSRRESAQASVKAAAEALREGLHIVVFPEGTRSKDGRLQSFKKGPFFLAMQTGAPIVPIAIAGTEKMMRKGSWEVTPGVARVQMLASIDPGSFATREDLMTAVHAAIAAALPDGMQPLQTVYDDGAKSRSSAAGEG